MDSPLADTPMASAMSQLPTSRTKDAIASTSNTFRLFDLPTELVLLILSHTCVSPSPIPITHANPSALQPAITRTDRLLRHEGLKLFYKHNTFHSPNTPYSLSDFWTFLTCIGPENLDLISGIWIEWVSGPWEPKSLEDRSWKHFVCEMEFLVKARLPMALQRREVFVRVKEGRIVMGKGALEQCYQISFRGHLNGEEWVSAKTLANEDGTGRIADGSQFWVRGGG